MIRHVSDRAAKRRVRRLRNDYSGMWEAGLSQAESHFVEQYGSAPPKGPATPARLTKLAGTDADAYVPGLMMRFVELGNDLDDLEGDAILAFQVAFQKRLTELFLGWPKGTLLDE